MKHHKKVIAGLAPVAAALLAASTAWAASTDTDDHFSSPSGTVVTGTNKAGTDITFKGTINGLPITVNCTSFKASGKLPATGLSVTLSAPPAITGCKDTLGGTDTIKTNQTNGKWKVVEIDAANDENATEPNTGDKVSLVVPKAGATFTSSIVSGCTITAAPTKPASITGPYNDNGTVSDSNAPIPVSASGCSASTATVSGTILLSPAVHDVS